MGQAHGQVSEYLKSMKSGSMYIHILQSTWLQIPMIAYEDLTESPTT